MKSLSITRAAVPKAPSWPKLGGADVIDLSGDYSQFTVPKPVAEAVVHAAQSTDLGRTTSSGRHLVDAILAKLLTYNDLEVDPEFVVVTGGGTAALDLALATLCDQGESVLLPDPGWPGFRCLTACWGIEPLAYPLHPDGTPDYDALEELAQHDTKVLVISQPATPMGAVLGADQLQELVDFCRAHDLYLLSDETYDLIRFSPGPALGPARFDTDGRVLTVYSFAKTHALAGLRLGYLVAAPPLAEAVATVQRAQMAGPSPLAVAAGLAALEMDFSVVDSMREFYQQQTDTLSILLPPEILPNPPAGGFHALLDIRGTGLPDGDAFADACYREQQLKVASGRRFGEQTAGCVRISMAARERVFGQAMERLQAFLEGHRA